MAEVDENFLSGAHKGFVISFAVTITIINLILIARLCKLGQKLFRRPFRYVLFWLAVGDILLLFNLIPRAIYYFEPSYYFNDLNCKTRILSYIYLPYMQFVYCTGIVVLGIELLSRTNLQTEARCMKSFFLAAFPYCLALVVVLPLYLMDIDWDYCIETWRERVKVVLWAVQIGPVSVALVFTIQVVSVCRGISSTADGSQQLDNPVTSGTSLSASPQPQYPQYLAPTAPSLYPEIPPEETPPVRLPPYSLHDETPPPAGHMNAPQGYGSSYQGYPYPHQGQPYLYQGQPYMPQPAPVPIHNQSYTQACTRQDTCRTGENWQLEMQKDKRSLLLVATATFIVMMPYFIYNAIYIYEPERDRLEGVVKVVIEEVFDWMRYLRPVLTAIIWSCSQKGFPN